MTNDELKLVLDGEIIPSPAVFEDWPLGGTRRGRMIFTIEADPKRGQRVHRASEGRKGHRTTYGRQWWIIRCSDGRTRLVCYSTNYAMLTIYDHTAKIYAFSDACTMQSNDPERYATLENFLELKD